MTKRLMVFAGAVLAMAVPAGGQVPFDNVDVTLAKYAVGCPTPFDTTGANNNLCEIRNAAADVKAFAGYRILQLPAGIIKIETSDLHAALAFSKRVSLAGAGQQRTSILLGNSKGAFLQVASASDCNNLNSYCNIEVHDLSISGNGVTTTGNVFDIVDTPYLHFWNMSIRQVNAWSINLVNDTERSFFEHIFIDTTLGAQSEGDGNETYFDGVQVLDSGTSDGNKCYDGPQCNPDHSIRQSGVIYPNSHMAVRLDGVVGKWNESSVKSTVIEGGVQLPPEGGEYHGGYVESAVPGAMNTAIVIGDGKIEIGHLTAAISATATVIPVDDARWQKPYVTDPALAQTVRVGAGRQAGCIYPNDYNVADSSPSVTDPGVAKNYCEPISVAAFAGDGNGYLQGTRNGHAWAAGRRVEMNPHNTYGATTVQGVHVNSILPFPWNAAIQDGCSDTAQLTTYSGSASQLCAEIIVGPVPDGLAVPFMHQTYTRQSALLHLIDTTFYTNNNANSEQDGQGWIKIPSNGQVAIDQGNGMLVGTPSRTSYQNGLTRVQFLADPQGGAALGSVNDPSARFTSDINNGLFDAYALPAYSQPMQHWTSTAPGASPAVTTH